MNNSAIRTWLLENSTFAVNSDIITDALHSLGWMIVQLLQSLADACETLYRVVFQLIDFTTWTSLESFLEQFRYAFIAFLTLALVALGIMLIFNHEKKPKIIINLCLAAFILCGSTAVLSGINSALKVWNNTLLDTQTTSSNELVRGSLIDWFYIDDTVAIADITSDNIENYIYPSVTDTDIEMIDINETIDYDEADISDDAKSIFSKKLVYVYGADGELTDVYDGVLGTGLFNEFYYRYHVDFFTLYLKLIALLIVYLCMAYKVVRLIIEIVQARVVAVLYAADMTSHQKTARILCAIRDSYFILLLITVFVKIYILAQLYIDSMIDAGALVKAIMTLFLAFAIIDGPNFIQQLTGVDAGLQSGFGKLYAAARGSEMLAFMFTRSAHAATHAVHSHAATSGSRNSAAQNAVHSASIDNSQQSGASPDMDHTGAASMDTQNDAANTTDSNADPNINANQEPSGMNGQDSASHMDTHDRATSADMDEKSDGYVQPSQTVDPDMDAQQASGDPLNTFNPEENRTTANNTFEKMDADLHSPNINDAYESSGMEKENIVHYKSPSMPHSSAGNYTPPAHDISSDSPKGAD